MSSNPYKCGKRSGASQVLCDISGFPRGAVVFFALQGCYPARVSHRRFGNSYRFLLQWASGTNWKICDELTIRTAQRHRKAMTRVQSSSSKTNFLAVNLFSVPHLALGGVSHPKFCNNFMFHLMPLPVLATFMMRFTSSIHLFWSLSYDRSKASSKASSPHSAIQSFLFQMRISSPFLKVIQ
jgi:hypothetical protein